MSVLTTCNTCGEARTTTGHSDEKAAVKCGESFKLLGRGIAVCSASAMGLGVVSLFRFIIKNKTERPYRYIQKVIKRK